LTIALLTPLCDAVPAHAAIWQALGYAHREKQNLEPALAALVKAAAIAPDNASIAPDNASIAVAVAQMTYESGRSAVHLFQEVRQRLPENLDIARGTANALAADGDVDAAKSVLKNCLAAHPDWLDGHKALTALRITSGDDIGFKRSYAVACGTQPQNLG
jgi:tetratricopeptide (TPR) repeat protein